MSKKNKLPGKPGSKLRLACEQIARRPSLLVDGKTEAERRKLFLEAVRHAQKAIDEEDCFHIWGDHQVNVDYLWGAYIRCFPTKGPPPMPKVVSGRDARAAVSVLLIAAIKGGLL